MAFDAAPLRCPDTPVAPDAKAAVEAVIAAGAKILIEEPWRVGRITRGADALTFPELAAEVKRRRALSPPTDFNRALALGQLARALEAPAFAVAWSARPALARDRLPPQVDLGARRLAAQEAIGRLAITT